MIEHLIINSFVIFGIFAATQHGMIFHFVARFVTKRVMSFFLWAYGHMKLKTVKKWHHQKGHYLEDICIDATDRAANSTAYVLRPIFDCPPCMASVWGIPFALMQPISIWTLVYLASLTGLNFIIMRIVTNNGRD